MIRRLSTAFMILACLASYNPALASERVMTELPDAKPAPGFKLPGTDGHSHDLSQYRGRYVLVNFWAVWCAPCRKEMPSMERIYQTFKGEDFEMLAIHVGPTLDGARDYAKQLELSFPILVDEELSLSDWKVRGLPSTYLLDPEGNVIAKAVGDREWDTQAMQAQLNTFMGRSHSRRVH